ncbi:hypothetical protein [Candidatus Nitrosopumilus sediminis]|uniref:hypothetical protein n=1 Tax=Candidatus Nitrosopumilus sediminis TaxID=1229909 RepID=UPI000476D826|nr:hypothetical protein [Candidatus Nitrosopumilus sediminis]
MHSNSCRICESKLEVEHICKVCEEPTRLFCHTCGIEAEKITHPACLVIDLNRLVVESLRQK